MNCTFCEGETTKKKVKRQHWLDGKLYIIENVEAEICIQRDEHYFHSKTLKKIVTYLKSDHGVKDRIEVEVVRM
jgi:YgiT-type zinc finger domain-containing protein